MKWYSVHPSVRLSVPFARCGIVQKVCYYGPGRQEISVDCCMAGATTAQGMQQQMYAGSATLTTIVVT